MSTIRTGSNSVIVVVDVQVGNMANVWDRSRVIENIRVIVNRARSQMVPVIWVQHEGPDLPRDSTSWQIVSELQPASGERRVDKRFESSFEETSLESCLAESNATHIILVGAASNWCIRATAYAALDRGYDLTLIKDAHTTGSIDLEDGSRIDAETIIKDLNLTMTWLTYPGRKCGTATAADADFANPNRFQR